MQCLIVLFAVAAISSAQLIPVHHAYGVSPFRTQYHAQDALGQYSFGYTGGPSSKHESSAGGVTQGAFSYVDAHGLVQSRSYVADPAGFHVAATDIPVDANTPIAAHIAPVAHPLAFIARRKRQAVYASHPLAYSAAHPLAYAAHPLAYAAHPLAYHSALPADTPVVAAAKIAHYNQFNYESIRNAHLAGRKKRSAVYTPFASVYAAPHHLVAAPVAAPAFYHAAPIAPVAIAPAVSTQYHAQDELGQYNYGYSTPTSSKAESRFANGVTQGGYSYVDGHGLIQSASYVSDPHHGFRVAATNLPVAPVA